MFQIQIGLTINKKALLNNIKLYNKNSFLSHPDKLTAPEAGRDKPEISCSFSYLALTNLVERLIWCQLYYAYLVSLLNIVFPTAVVDCIFSLVLYWYV